MTMNKLTAADLYVIHQTIYQSLKVANYGGIFPNETRTKTMDKVMSILAHIDIDVTATEVEPECEETGDGV